MVSPCRRFETEGLLLVEQGQPQDEALREHLATCSECSEAQRVYRALRSDLGFVGSGARPPADWQEAVRHRIQARAATKAPAAVAPAAVAPATPPSAPALRPWGLWGGLAAAVLAIAAVSLLFLPTAPPSLSVSVKHDATSMRGIGAQPGDILTLEASVDTSEETRHRELRLYRNDRDLVARCPGSPGCKEARGNLRLTLTLPAVGTYQPVLVYGPQPLPEASAGLDADSGSVVSAGGKVELGTEIVVR